MSPVRVVVDVDVKSNVDVNANVDVEVDVKVGIGVAISSIIYQCIVRTKEYTNSRCAIVVGGGGGGGGIVLGSPTGPEQIFPLGQHPMIPLLAITQYNLKQDRLQTIDTWR